MRAAAEADVLSNPYAPPRAADVTPKRGVLGEDAGDRPWPRRIQLAMTGVMAAVHLVFFIGALTLEAQGKGMSSALALPGGKMVGALVMHFAALVWGPVGTAWCALNLVAITGRARFAYTSLAGYWLVNVAMCACAPFGLIGLAHLLLSRARLSL